MVSVFYKIYLFYFFVLVLPFLSIASCGGGAGNSSADLNLSAQTCGNALVNENEGCDDGNVNNSDGCNAHCAWEVGEAICGNGVLENEECCDDGNNVSGDGCSAVCTSEKNNRPPSAPILAAEPANGATWAPTRLYLSWSPSTDPDAGDRVAYDVYFMLKGDRDSIPSGIDPYKVGISSTHFIIQASTDNRAEYFPDQVPEIYLSPDSQYLWKVCARDSSGAQNCSETRTFNTDDSVVGWWRFDENPLRNNLCPDGSAANVCDYSGKGNHGVSNNFGANTWLMPSMSEFLGGALQFDGENDYIEVPNAPSLNPNNQMSMEVTQNLNRYGYGSGVDRPFLGKCPDFAGPDNGYWFGFGWGEDLYMVMGNLQVIQGAGDDTIGNWLTFVSTYDGSSAKLYKEGNLLNSNPVTGLINYNSLPLWLGRSMHYSSASYYAGKISEALIYDRSLNYFEIANHQSSKSGD